MSISGYLCQQKSKKEKPLPLPSFHIDEKLTIRCLLPGIHEEQELTGRIRKLNKTKHETRIDVEFAEIPPSVEKTMTHYLS